MKTTMRRTPPRVEDQLDRLWSDPVELDEASITAMDELLGRDVEQLAAILGIDRRELNKQRERRDDLFGKRWLYRLALICLRARQRFGPARSAPVARIVAHAAGFELAEPVLAHAADTSEGASGRMLADAMKEFGEFVSLFAHAANGGIDPVEAKAVLPELEQVLEKLEQIRLLLVERGNGRGRNVTPIGEARR